MYPQFHRATVGFSFHEPGSDPRISGFWVTVVETCYSILVFVYMLSPTHPEKFAVFLRLHDKP